MSDLLLQNRREFIKYSAGLAATLYGTSAFGNNKALPKNEQTVLTILYTNDTHSRIEPFPANDAKYAGEGGFSKRARLIESIRKNSAHVLLLDAGDIFQGTPYFNYYHGELEYKLMSLMGYDATTFGNHDFDLGCENILKQMPHAGFDFINCNYNLNDTALAGNKKILPYKIYKKGPLKIGVLGVGIDLENLVDKKYANGIIYNDPIFNANKISSILRYDEKCDYIICLSHLGFRYDTKKISDVVLATQTKNIDLIIGGHTHTFLEKPYFTSNSEGKEVSVTQVGWAGIWLGQVEVYFTANNKKISHSANKHAI
ncbi:MAG: metallophosphatase [Bacteroidia bacterium]|nr:metallophosphatase [Bacteroidia bacterium]